LTKLKRSLNLSFLATKWFTKICVRHCRSGQTAISYTIYKMCDTENVSKLLSISFHVLTPRYFMDLWRRDDRYLGIFNRYGLVEVLVILEWMSFVYKKIAIKCGRKSFFNKIKHKFGCFESQYGKFLKSRISRFL